MTTNNYLRWLADESGSVWWNDSADPVELENAIANGALGVTTNPVLVAKTLAQTPEVWRELITGAADTEERTKRVTCKIASRFEPFFTATKGAQGYVCAQVDPRRAGDRDFMLAMVKRLAAWAPNIAVKLPVTAAGLDVLEECTSLGITVTATVSYTVPQVIAAAERHRAGSIRAKRNGIVPGHLFAVVMVGRIDDYLRDVVNDSRLDVPEEHIVQAGTAIIKRAYKYFLEHEFDAVLMPAGMRGAYHTEALAGAGMSMSIHPSIQAKLRDAVTPYRCRIDEEVAPEVIASLEIINEFQRAYEFDGMKPEEFITYGVVQKTLAQFIENYQRI